jgi:Tfp pilus assembly protein PilV
LFEVLVAIAILVLGFISVGKAMNMAFRATAASEASLKAVNIARMHTEWLRGLAFSASALNDGTTPFTRSVTNGAQVVTYNGLVIISTRNTNANLKDVTVQVDWTTPYHRTSPPPVEVQTTISRVLRL